MAQNKTTETQSSVADFINALPDEVKRADSLEIVRLMHQATGAEPRMWGPSIIGFDRYHYKYESGHEGDAPVVSFSPRSNAISLYIGGFPESEGHLARLGKYKSGKSCIYIKKLSDIDVNVLETMIADSVKFIKDKYFVN